MYDSCFNGDHGDLIYIYITQILSLEEYVSQAALACIFLQKFANWNSFPTYSALLWTESSIFVSAFFCDVFLGTFTLHIRFIVVYSTIVSYVFFILYCTKWFQPKMRKIN